MSIAPNRGVHTGLITLEQVRDPQADQHTRGEDAPDNGENEKLHLNQNCSESSRTNRELFIRATAEKRPWADEAEIFVLEKMGVPLRLWERGQDQDIVQLKPVSASSETAPEASEFVELLRTGDHFVAITDPEWSPDPVANSAPAPGDDALRENSGQRDCFYLAVAAAAEGKSFSEEVRSIRWKTPPELLLEE